MANIQNPFINNINDLGGDTPFGLTKSQVDSDFLGSIYPSSTPCFLCGNTASYRLIAKEDRYNTAQIQDKGFVCSTCLAMNSNIDKNHYGIREI